MTGVVLASLMNNLIETSTFEAAPVIHPGADSPYPQRGVIRSEEWKHASPPLPRDETFSHLREIK